MTPFILGIFVVTYAGMAVGRFPGLRIDRAGIALVAAIALAAVGAVDDGRVAAAIDFPTLFVLFGLMILSAQFAASGFYDWCSSAIARASGSPARLLAATIAVAGGLSSVLANDVVVFAMTPLLCVGLRARGLDPRPFLIALASAANAGSAATIIGNPQNILIGQVGRLDFWHFAAVCGVPAAFGLGVVFVVVWLGWHERWTVPPDNTPVPDPVLIRRQLVKAVAATVVVVAAFTTPLRHEVGVLAVAGVLLVSRTLASRRMLGMVDWQLLVLFAGLFVVNGALAATGLPAQAIAALAEARLLPDTLSVMTPLALAASNTIGNVPTVVLLLAVWPEIPPGALHGLALLSTLAGNLFLLGSLANLITVERAASVGSSLGFIEHARCGIPITLLSMSAAALWLWATGTMAW